MNVEYGGPGGWVAMNWDDAQGGNVSWQSVDGVVWSEGDVMRPPNASNRGMGLATNGSLYVHSCDGGYVGQSVDGLNWTHVSNTGMLKPDNLTYGDGTFLAVNTNESTYQSEVFTSRDGGANWNKQAWSFPYRITSRLGYYDDNFIALGYRPSSPDAPSGIWYSPDGITWEEASSVPRTGALGALQDACFGNGKYVVVGTGGTIWTASESGSTWYADASDLGSGWRWSAWLGTFNVSSDPWIYHEQHGWLYTFLGSAGPDGVYFWDGEMGSAVWTSEAFYPSMYRFSDNQWIYYTEGSANPRLFVNLLNGQWEQW
jgi:hypothetical protein